MVEVISSHAMLANADAGVLYVAAIDLGGWLHGLMQFIKVLIGFSIIVFVHEMGHFLAAKWCGVRVDRFAVGLGPRLFGWRPGQGFTLGSGGGESNPTELAARGWGETDYCFKALPLGGYVKMLGEHDFDIDDRTGEIRVSNDPRAFVNKSVGARMTVASAGVIFNLLFAAVAFMSVFLVGYDAPAPIIGEVLPGSPADQAGLQSGDRVLEINGRKVDFWQDIEVRAALSSKPFEMTIQRDGKTLPEALTVAPEYDPLLQRPSIGVGQAVQFRAANDWPRIAERMSVKRFDHIVALERESANTGDELRDALLMVRERDSVWATVIRPHDPEKLDGESDRLVVSVPMECGIDSTELPTAVAREALRTPANVLGFAPRFRVPGVEPGRPADRAGLRAGDVLVRFGPVMHPTHPEVSAVINASQRKPFPVTVLRDGKLIELRLSPEPRSRFNPFGDKSPYAGLHIGPYIEQGPVVVGQLVPDTPAAGLGLARGTQIEAVDGQAVSTWRQFFQALTDRAGRNVRLACRLADDAWEVDFAVPTSILSEQSLPTNVNVLAVEDQRTVQFAGGRALSVGSLPGLTEALRQHIGRRVRVTVAAQDGRSASRTVEFDVTASNYVPWELQWGGKFPPSCIISPVSVLERVHADGNPFRALLMGMRYTLQNVTAVYQSMHQVAVQNVGTQNISGPVGIFSTLMQFADVGWRQLLFIFAILSVNLAVINFLPLPVMDGGLMMFLIIEKLRGKPLSMKMQMTFTMVGLAVIGMIFIVVTIQDVAKLLP